MNTLPFKPATPEPSLALRDYQAEAVLAIYAWFEKRRDNPLIVLPTGSGKSLVIAGFARDVLSVWPTQRILVLTHVRELVAQNAERMRAVWADAPIGVYSAGLKRRDTHGSITFAGIQSIYKKAEELGVYDLVIVDECHLIPDAGAGMYLTYLDALRSMNPKVKVIGFTATPFRTDSGSLCDREKLFGGVAYEAEIGRLIKDGWLCRLVPKSVDGQINTAGVHKQAGDFVGGELEQAAMAGDRVKLACTEIVQYGAARRSWLVFACGIAHAETVADELRRRGVQVACIFGNTPSSERDSIIAEYKAGQVRAIVNVGVLTTGFDAPATDMLAILRPTCSPGLFLQMVGRGMRLAPGKDNCLVLDFGGNVQRHGPIDMIRPKGKSPGKKEAGAPPVKVCPTCKTIVFAGCRECADCGYVWPPGEVTHDIVAGTDALLSGDAPHRFSAATVDRVTYSRHPGRDGKRDTMRVTYWCGVMTIDEWVSIEHTGYARSMAEAWWRRRAATPVPGRIEDALDRQRELITPTSLMVDTNGRYPRIVGIKFPAAASAPHHAEDQADAG